MAFLSGIGGALGGVGLGAAVVEVAADTTALKAGLAQAKGEVAAATSGVNASTKAIGTGFIVAGAAAALGMGKAVSATVELAGATKSLQRITGQSAEDASALVFVAEKLGVSNQSLTQGFGLLAKNISLGAPALEKYGLEVKNSDGSTRDFNVILAEAADKYVALGGGLDGAAFAQEVFGRGGKALIPILAQGSDGISAFIDEAQKYGVVLSQDMVDKSRELAIAQRDLGTAFEGLKVSVGTELVPLFTTFVHGATALVVAFNAIPGPIKAGILLFTALTGGMLLLQKATLLVSTAWGPLIAKLGLGAAAEETAAVGATQLSLALDAEAASATAAEVATGGFLAKLALLARGGATGIGLATPFNVTKQIELPPITDAEFTDLSKTYDFTVPQKEAQDLADVLQVDADAARLAQEQGISYSAALKQVEAAAAGAAGAEDGLAGSTDDATAAADAHAAALKREKDATQGLTGDVGSLAASTKALAADKKALAHAEETGHTSGARYNALVLQTAADTQAWRQDVRGLTNDLQASGKTNEEAAAKLIRMAGGFENVSGQAQAFIYKLLGVKRGLDQLHDKTVTLTLVENHITREQTVLGR